MTPRESLLAAAREALARAAPDRRATVMIQVHLAGTGSRARRLEAVRGAPWGELIDAPGFEHNVYSFLAHEVVRWLEEHR